MSMVYIVDGYNAMNRSDLFQGGSLKDSRAKFLGYLECRRPQGSLKNRLIVVFDGSREVFGQRESYNFEVQFTSGETADDKIKELVSGSARPKTIVVVTDDKALGLSVRSCGARLMSVDEFLSKKKERVCADDSPGLNIVQREKITQELKQIWLKKKSC